MKDKAREKLILQILKFFGNKKVYLSKKSAEKELRKQSKKSLHTYNLPRKFQNFAERNKLVGSYGTMEYFTKKGEGPAIFFVHGGAFCTRPSGFHWMFLDNMFKKTGANIYVPLYPLCPHSTYKQTYLALKDLYKFISQRHENVYIIGDSAGATLALGLAQLIKAENLNAPKAVFAFSPVLDMTFSNEDFEKFEKFDPMLSKEGCKYICQAWAKGANLTDPLISPMFGNFDNFPDTYIFYGTYEILCPDIRKFIKLTEKQNFKLFAFEEKMLYHDYPLYPIPKAERAQSLIANIINQKQK